MNEKEREKKREGGIGSRKGKGNVNRGKREGKVMGRT